MAIVVRKSEGLDLAPIEGSSVLTYPLRHVCRQSSTFVIIFIILLTSNKGLSDWKVSYTGC